MDTTILPNPQPIQPNKKIFGILIIVGVVLVIVVVGIVLMRRNKTTITATTDPVRQEFTAAPSILDTDHDTLGDIDETQKYHTDPNKFDTDGDGLSDAQEVLIFKTDPNNAHSMRPDMPDGVAIRLQPKK